MNTPNEQAWPSPPDPPDPSRDPGRKISEGDGKVIARALLGAIVVVMVIGFAFPPLLYLFSLWLEYWKPS